MNKIKLLLASFIIVPLTSCFFSTTIGQTPKSMNEIIGTYRLNTYTFFVTKDEETSLTNYIADYEMDVYLIIDGTQYAKYVYSDTNHDYECREVKAEYGHDYDNESLINSISFSSDSFDTPDYRLGLNFSLNVMKNSLSKKYYGAGNSSGQKKETSFIKINNEVALEKLESRLNVSIPFMTYFEDSIDGTYRLWQFLYDDVYEIVDSKTVIKNEAHNYEFYILSIDGFNKTVEVYSKTYNTEPVRKKYNYTVELERTFYWQNGDQLMPATYDAIIYEDGEKWISSFYHDASIHDKDNKLVMTNSSFYGNYSIDDYINE